MPYPNKQFYACGFMCREEASYLDPAGVSVLSPTTDGVPLHLEGRAIPVPYSEDFDGKRDYGMAARSPQAFLAPSQAVVQGIELQFRWKGNSTVYASNVWPLLHRLIKASGWDASFAGGAWTRVPWAGGSITSLVAALFSGSHKYPLTGVLCNWRWVAERGKPRIDTFRLWGLLGTPTEDRAGGQQGAEALALTYPSPTLDEPKADGMSVGIGDFVTADVTKIEFDSGWADPTPRGLVSLPGYHGGFARSVEFEPRLKFTIEAPAFVNSPYHASGGLDPFQLRKTAQKITGSKIFAQLGSAAGNRSKTTLVQGQVVAPIVQEEIGSIVGYTIETRPYSSTPTANDAITIVDD